MPAAKKLEDLFVWRTASGLRDEIHRLTETGQAARDFAFRDQIRDAAASAPRNLAEGFGLYKPRQFGRHVRIALGSLHETWNHIRDGSNRGYFTADEAGDLLRRTASAIKASKRLLRYLDSLKGKAPSDWDDPPPASRKPPPEPSP